MNFFSYDNVIALQEMIFHALYRKLAETHDPLQYGPYNGTVPVGFRERVAGKGVTMETQANRPLA